MLPHYIHGKGVVVGTGTSAVTMSAREERGEEMNARKRYSSQHRNIDVVQPTDFLIGAKSPQPGLLAAHGIIRRRLGALFQWPHINILGVGIDLTGAGWERRLSANNTITLILL